MPLVGKTELPATNRFETPWTRQLASPRDSKSASSSGRQFPPSSSYYHRSTRTSTAPSRALRGDCQRHRKQGLRSALRVAHHPREADAERKVGERGCQRDTRRTASDDADVGLQGCVGGKLAAVNEHRWSVIAARRPSMMEPTLYTTTAPTPADASASASALPARLRRLTTITAAAPTTRYAARTSSGFVIALPSK